MTRPYRSQPNKTEQIAVFLLAKGKAMNSREIFDAGFRFADGLETTASGISVLLNKMHHSSRYTVDRQVRGYGGSATTMVRVLAIRSKSSSAPAGEMNGSQRDMWRQLLTRKHGAA